MNFGGPIDLTPFGSVVAGIGIVYWVIAFIALLLALKRPKTKSGKALATVIVLVVFGAMPVSSMWQSHVAYSRLKESMALFEKRCKTSGEKIIRTVENVEGVVWMKWRGPQANLADQFAMDDPYGHDCGGDDCIAQLLRITREVERNPEDARKHKGAYAFVEAIDPKDGRWYRYFGAMKLTPSWTPEAVEKRIKEKGEGPPSFSYLVSFEREPIDRPTARYGITWDDISTHGDREHWIAGGSLKVVNLQSNEVIAERVGYLIDRGQGSTAGFRTPWSWAVSNGPACPSLHERNNDFIFKTLQPR